MINDKNKNVILFIGFFLYKIILEILYALVISPNFEFVRFYNNLNSFKYIIGLSLFILMYVGMPKESNRPSYLVLQIHFVLMFIPMIVIYEFMNLSTFFMIVASSVFILESVLLTRIKTINILSISGANKILYLTLGLLTLYVYFMMIKANGLPSLKSLDFNYVYKIREKIVYPFFTGYLVPWQSKVINPFLISISVKKRNRLLLLISVGLQFFMYLMIPEKSFLFIPAVIIIVMLVIEKVKFLPFISVSAPLGAALILVFTEITQNIELASTFIRRVLFLPAQLKFYWYEYFSQNPKIMFSQGIIGKVFGVRNPYPKDAAKVIAEWFFKQPEMHSNSGYISDAYGNAGLIGVIFISLLFTFILLLIDSLSIKMDFGFTVGIILFHVISLNDGGLLTNMFTGGLILLLLILWIYCPEDAKSS